MQNKSINILCTRPIDNSLLERAKTEQIFIDELSFIETKPVTDNQTVTQIEQAATQNATIVFTSMNAVEAVADKLKNKQLQWNIYCIGTTTNELVKKYFGEKFISGTANSAAALAGLIVDRNDTRDITFFCGDQRREDLPQILRSNNIAVKEITVYKTTALSNKINKVYDGILFFSPSAVNSFFASNIIPPTTILFAIGSTTADEIKLFSSNKIIISEVPGKDNLVNRMRDYFKGNG